ncbi:16212_t:CDS:2, partial [Racocetra persica]
KILMEVRDELTINQPKTDSNSPPQSPPFDTSQPNVPNGGPNSPDTNQNSSNNQSPNQEKQNNPNDNGPIPNPPTNGDNHDPEKNDDSPLPNPDADIPPIDMSGINNAATTEQAQQEARTQIQQLFANKEYLKELTTQSEIATFVKEIEKEIREKYQTQQNKNNDSSPDSSNKNKILVWLIASGVLSAV